MHSFDCSNFFFQPSPEKRVYEWWESLQKVRFLKKLGLYSLPTVGKNPWTSPRKKRVRMGGIFSLDSSGFCFWTTCVAKKSNKVRIFFWRCSKNVKIQSKIQAKVQWTECAWFPDKVLKMFGNSGFSIAYRTDSRPKLDLNSGKKNFFPSWGPTWEIPGGYQGWGPTFKLRIRFRKR